MHEIVGLEIVDQPQVLTEMVFSVEGAFFK